MSRARIGRAVLVGWVLFAARAGEGEIKYPPRLPGGRQVATDTTEEFLKPPESMKHVAVAVTTREIQP